MKYCDILPVFFGDGTFGELETGSYRLFISIGMRGIAPMAGSRGLISNELVVKIRGTKPL